MEEYTSKKKLYEVMFKKSATALPRITHVSAESPEEAAELIKSRNDVYSVMTVDNEPIK